MNGGIHPSSPSPAANFRNTVLASTANRPRPSAWPSYSASSITHRRCTVSSCRATSTGNRATANLHRHACCIRHAASPRISPGGTTRWCCMQPITPSVQLRFVSLQAFSCPADFPARRSSPDAGADATQRCPRRHIAPYIFDQRLERQSRKRDPCRSTDATHTQKARFLATKPTSTHLVPPPFSTRFTPPPSSTTSLLVHFISLFVLPLHFPGLCYTKTDQLGGEAGLRDKEQSGFRKLRHVHPTIHLRPAADSQRMPSTSI